MVTLAGSWAAATIAPHGSAMMFAQQRVIGRYLVGDAIGAGGMATVHFGRLLGPAGFSRTVAIKQLRPGLPSDEESLATFLDEARLASRIHHPNVVSPIDVVLMGNEAFIVMEYVHGESLSRLLKTAPGVPVAPPLAAAIMGQVLLGMHAAHRAVSEEGAPLELVHRDVSPQNILITPDGVARLLDFGIAKAVGQSHHTMNGVLKGKLAYMAPEQVTSAPLDRRTDLFAAGTVFWEMLTGQRLFLADTPAACVQKILHDPIPAPSTLASGVPPEVDEVVLRALARDPDERFADAQSMALALAAAVRSASTLEVGAWVTELCGDVLLDRSDRIADFEAVPLEELTLGLPVESLGGTGSASALTVPKEAAAPPLPDAAGGGSRSARFRRRAALIAAAVLTFGTLSVAGPRAIQRLSTSVRRGAVPVAQPGAAPVAQPGAGHVVQPGAHSVAQPVVPTHAAVESEPAHVVAALEVPSSVGARASQSVSSSMEVAAREPVHFENARRSAVQGRHRGPRDGTGASRSADSGSGDAVPALAPDKPVVTNKSAAPEPAAVKASPGCDIPYTIDARGVKRFNPDCL